MDPKFKGDWSASEIKMVKSLIARDNANNNGASDMNKKHNQIVDELQAMFPSKEKHQATNLYVDVFFLRINLYVDVMVEMMQTLQSGNQHVEASSNLINQPFGVFVGDPSMGNKEAFNCYQQVEMFGVKNVKDTPRRKPTPRKESQHTGRFWTTDEHRLVIC